MSDREYVRLGLRILDEQIVDCEGRRCGRVEDLELSGGPGEPTRVEAILCGATAWKRRLPAAVAELVPGDPAGLRRVPWEDIDEIENEILLKRSQEDLDRASEGEPDAFAVSQVLRAQVLDRTGTRLGHVGDVLASKPAGSEDNVPWKLEGLLVGRQGLLQRAGFSPLLHDEIKHGEVPENLVAWRRVERRTTKAG